MPFLHKHRLSAGLMADGELSALDGWLVMVLYGIYVILCGTWGKIDALLSGGPKEGADDEASASETLEAGTPTEALLGGEETPEAPARHFKPAVRVMQGLSPRSARSPGGPPACPPPAWPPPPSPLGPPPPPSL